MAFQWLPTFFFGCLGNTVRAKLHVACLQTSVASVVLVDYNYIVHNFLCAISVDRQTINKCEKPAECVFHACVAGKSDNCTSLNFYSSS